jgi:S-adenosylmethionine decarboxylase
MNNNENDFEGLEKHILINFISNDLTSVSQSDSIDGCRKLSYEDLSSICKEVQCNILSKLSNNFFDSYILSESSLFVYPFKIVLMTCGSTTILKAIDLILKLTNEKLNLIPLSIIYYRNKFMFEDKQLYPHQSINQELDYLINNEKINKDCKKNYTHILGDLNNDYLLINQNIAITTQEPPLRWQSKSFGLTSASESHTVLFDLEIFKIMMFDIDNDIAKLFYKSEKNLDLVEEIINKILPKNIKIDEHYFTPCGFSLNAIIDEYYYTIHITPNSGCSYVSFETNQPIENHQYLINNVINIFLGKKIIINFINCKNEYFDIKYLDNYSEITSKICKVNNNLYCSLHIIT